MDGTCKNASNYPCDYRVCDRVECAIEHELRSDSRTAPTHRSLSIDSFSALAQLAFSDAFSSNLKRKQPLSVDIGNFTEHLVDCNRGLRLHQMHFHRRFQFNYSKYYMEQHFRRNCFSATISLPNINQHRSTSNSF